MESEEGGVDKEDLVMLDRLDLWHWDCIGIGRKWWIGIPLSTSAVVGPNFFAAFSLTSKLCQEMTIIQIEKFSKRTKSKYKETWIKIERIDSQKSVF